MSECRLCTSVSARHFRDVHPWLLARVVPFMTCALALNEKYEHREDSDTKSYNVEQTRPASHLFTYFCLHTEDNNSRGKPGELPLLGNSCKATISGKEFGLWENEE